MNFFQRLFSRKESLTRTAISISNTGSPVNTPRNYRAMSDQAYKANVVAFRAISLVASLASRVQWDLFQGDKEVESSPLLDLIRKPNPMQGKQQFYEAYYAYLLLSGNSYVEFNPEGNGELWPVRPDYVKIIAGGNGLPAAYEFCPRGNGERVVFPVDQIDGWSALLQTKFFHPTDDWYGMAPLEAAMLSVDQHNEAGRWNLSLLQRGAKPSGALVVSSTAFNPGGTLQDEEYQKLKERIDELHTGSNNAGRPIILEGGLDWKQLALSPVDMDFLNTKNLSAREVALALGVPPLLLNISGDNTYSNMAEARLALYDETIIPLVMLAVHEFNRWLAPKYGDGLELRPDLDSIDAMVLKRKTKFETANLGAAFLTINERREMVGFDKIEGGDVLDSVTPVEPEEESPEENEEEANDTEQETEEENEDAEPSEEGIEDNAEEEDAEKSHEDILLLPLSEIKQVNVIGRREKTRTAKRLFRKREAYAFGMERDLKEILEDIARKFGTIKTNDARLAEMEAASIVTDFEPEIAKVLSKYIRRVAKDFASPIIEGAKSFGYDWEVKKDDRFSSWLNDFTKKHTAERIEDLSSNTIKKARAKIKRIVADAIEGGQSNYEIGSELEDTFKGLSEGRARTIARTEVAIAANSGALEAAKSLGIPDLEKEWVAVNDDRTRDDPEHADHAGISGKKVKIDEKFNVEPDTLMEGPGDPTAPAEQVINCRCALVFSRARS